MGALLMADRRLLRVTGKRFEAVFCSFDTENRRKCSKSGPKWVHFDPVLATNATTRRLCRFWPVGWSQCWTSFHANIFRRCFGRFGVGFLINFVYFIGGSSMGRFFNGGAVVVLNSSFYGVRARNRGFPI